MFKPANQASDLGSFLAKTENFDWLAGITLFNKADILREMKWLLFIGNTKQKKVSYFRSGLFNTQPTFFEIEFRDPCFSSSIRIRQTRASSSLQP